MALFLYQLKQALLSLKQKQTFVFSVVTTMGITLGALLCVLTLAYVMLYKPLPYPEQHQLFSVESRIVGNENAPKMSMYPYPALVNLYQQQTALGIAGMIVYDSTNISSIAYHPRVNSSFVTPEFLLLLNMPMLVGRRFEASEALNTHNPVAIISHATWVDLFNQQDDIINQSLVINGISFRIIGVAEDDFLEPPLYEVGLKTEVWLPWDFNLAEERRRQAWGNFAPNMFLLGKLQNESSVSAAQTMLTPVLSERWQQELAGNPRFKSMSLAVQLTPLIDVIKGSSDVAIKLLLIAVIALLAIALTNISYLFVARVSQQQQQTAIRLALGINKKQLFFALLTELGCLLLMAFVVALVVAESGFWLFQHYFADIFNRTNEMQLSLPPILVMLFICFAIILVFAKLGLKQTNFHQINNHLQQSNKGVSSSLSKRFQQTIVSGQVLITMLVVFANIAIYNTALTAIMHSSDVHLSNIQRLVLVDNTQQQRSAEERLSIFQQVSTELTNLSEVKSVSHGDSLLTGVSIRPYKIGPEPQELMLEQATIDQAYFPMFELALIQGINFSEVDIIDDNAVAIVNEKLAHELSQYGEVIGQKIITNRGVPLTVIGVAPNIILPTDKSVSSRIYRPITLTRESGFVLQLHDNQMLARETLAKLITNIDSQFSIFEYHSLASQYQKLQLNHVLILMITVTLTVLTLCLAGLGLYGVIDFSNQMRRYEIGTRMAIGAKGKDILRLVFNEHALAYIIGISASLLVLLTSYLVFGEQLRGYITNDAMVILMVTLLLIAIPASVACYLPLRKYIRQPIIHSLKGND